MASTYIKLYRSLIDHDTLANDNTAFIVFTKLLLRVNWKTGTIRTGRHKLAAMTNLPKSTCWDALHRLQTDSIVTLRPTGRYTDISICNWEKYQGGADSYTDKRPTANRTPTDTINNNRRSKNINKDVLGKDNELLTILNRETNRNFRTLPNGYKKTLATFSLAEITKALRNIKKSKWHREKLSTLKSDFFLRDTTIDNFLNYEEKTNYPGGALSGTKPEIVNPENLQIVAEMRAKILEKA